METFERAARREDGTLRTLARDGALAEAAEALVLEALGALEKRSEFTTVAGREAYFKGAPLKTGPALRHGLARALMRRAPPRAREFSNLAWLHERHFEVPAPLAASVLMRGGLPRYQALVTERIPHSRTLESFLDAEPDHAARAPILAELAAEVARMHAIGFVHHDLFARNVLVRDQAGPRRHLVFLDAWAGGPGGSARGFAYDLGCFFLDATEMMNGGEQATFLETYFEHRARQGAPARHASTVERARRARARLRRRLQRDPKRMRGRGLPREDSAALGA